MKPYRRGGRYYVRRRVPKDLVESFGRAEIVRALGTADRALASMLCTAANAAIDELIARARLIRTQAAHGRAGSLETMHEDEWNPEGGTLAEEIEDERTDRLAEAIAARIAAFASLATGTAAPRIAQRSAPVPEVPTAPEKPARVQAKDDRSLDTLVDLWAAERNPVGQVLGMHRLATERFRLTCGPLQVPEITKTHVVDYKDAIQREHGPGVAKQSVARMQTLLRFAMGRAWINTNPAEGVGVTMKAKGAAKAARPPFSLDTLRRLFASPVYSEGLRAYRGAGEAQYWLPLLGLYTGARIEELAQLRPEDIYEEEYKDADGKKARAWVLRITSSEEHGQGVKNAGSVRRIPIHGELLTRGFVEYARSMEGKPRIFSALKADKYGVESAFWGKWWNQDYLRKYCDPQPKEVFHSFRHTFKDVCREHGITKELADAIQGHTDGSASGSYGGEYYPLRPLVEAMQRYSVDL